MSHENLVPVMASSTFPSPPPRLVISDIDGTFLDDAGNLPPINREALELCRHLHVPVCLATGRRWTTCSKLLDRLQLHHLIDFCILNNGMLIRSVPDQKILFQREFPLALALKAIEALNLIGIDPVLLGHNQDGLTKDVFYRREDLLNGDFIAKNLDHVQKISYWKSLQEAHLVEIILIGKKPELEKAAQALSKVDLEVVILRNSFYSEYMLEATPKDISKFQGAEQLLSHLHLNLTDAIAIGDSDNDYTLLKNIPRSFMVSNGVAHLKEIVTEVTKSNNEGGFGEMVFKVFKVFKV